MMNETKTALRRCPKCFHLPTATIEDKGTFFKVSLQCEQHGHMAMGDSLEQAEKHWNTYIEMFVEFTEAA